MLAAGSKIYIAWAKLYNMDATYKPEVNDELDT